MLRCKLEKHSNEKKHEGKYILNSTAPSSEVEWDENEFLLQWQIIFCIQTSACSNVE